MLGSARKVDQAKSAQGHEETAVRVKTTSTEWVCQVFCVNDLAAFVLGFGFVVGLGFWFCCCCWFWGWSAGEGGLSPSLAYPRRRKPEIALCQSPWPGHALGPQHGEVI